MNNIKEALEFLAQQAVLSQRNTFRPDSEPEDTYFLRGADGKYERMQAEPDPRDYVASAFEDFVELIKSSRGNATKTLVMVGARGVVGLLDEVQRRERVTFLLRPTMGFLTVKECEKRRPLGQREFVSMMRVELNGCVDPILIAAFKHIRFEKSSDGEQQISNSNKAISSKIQMKLAAGGADIPEEITLDLAVYEEFPTIKKAVRCVVETCIEEGTFTLIPVAGELLSAQVKTQGEIQRGLIERFKSLITVNVHCGEIHR